MRWPFNVLRWSLSLLRWSNNLLIMTACMFCDPIALSRSPIILYEMIPYFSDNQLHQFLSDPLHFLKSSFSRRLIYFITWPINVLRWSIKLSWRSAYYFFYKSPLTVFFYDTLVHSVVCFTKNLKFAFWWLVIFVFWYDPLFYDMTS